MSASRMIAILTVVALPLLLAGYMKGKAAPAPDSHRQMKASLETLQNKLPASVTEVLRKVFEGQLKEASDQGLEIKLKQLEAKVENARITGPSEARIFISISAKVDLLPFPSPIYCIAYLHYFDGQWTTTRIEPSSNKGQSALEDIPLMLAIDRAGEK